MIRYRFITIPLAMLGFFWAQAQKTYFIETERPTQQVFIDGKPWDKEAFFTVDPSDGYHQVIVKEEGYKNHFDVLKHGVHTVFSTEQKINADTTILALVKPIELDINKAKKSVYEIDYTSYMKDMEYSGELSTVYPESSFTDRIISNLAPQNQYLINELNVYHNMTIGRYKFYALSSVKEIAIYEVVIDENTRFLQASISADWSITAKNTENLPTYNYTGMSGKVLYTPSAHTQGSAVNAVVHDALFSSLLNFLAEQEGRIKRNM